MRLLAPTVALFALTTCSQLSDRPAQFGAQVSVPQILLSRLDDQLHLRVFPAMSSSGTAFTCMAGQGQVYAGGTLATHGFGGDRVNPSIRCGSMWQSQMAMFDGVSMPVDTCFSQTAPMQMVQVPAGSYIVLVEGSGVATTGGANFLLGSGCAAVTTMAGSTLMVSIDMVEQTNTGTCGDSVVAADESCDPPDGTNCDASCQFVEVSATVPPPGGDGESTLGAGAQPTIGWAPGQEMVVGFTGTNTHLYTHLFDLNGAAISNPVVLQSDLVIASMGRGQLQGLRIAAYADGFAATWQSTARTFSDFDVDGTFADYASYPPAPDEVYANPTSMQPGQNRTNPAVAVNGSTVVFLYQDSTTNGLRIATTTVSGGTIGTPASDAALIATGPSTSMPTSPVITATTNGFVAAWTAGVSGSQDVYAVALDATGHVMGTPIVANSVTTGNQTAVAVALNGTNVVMSWHDDSGALSGDTQGGTVAYRAFSTSLAPMSADVAAPTTTAGDQVAPAIAVSPAGVVFIAWQNAMDNTIRAIEINVDGSSVLNHVNGTASDFAAAEPGGSGVGPSSVPAVAYGGASLFGVVWQDDGVHGIRMRTFL